MIYAAVAAVVDSPRLIHTADGLMQLAECVCTAARLGSRRDPARHLFFDDLQLAPPYNSKGDAMPIAVIVGEVGEFGLDIRPVSHWRTFTLNLRIRSLTFFILHMHIAVGTLHVDESDTHRVTSYRMRHPCSHLH